MPFTLGNISVQHDKIDEVSAALAQYVHAVAAAEPQRAIEIFRVPYSNRFYFLIEYAGEEDQKKHRGSAAMQNLLKSTHGSLLNDIEFTDLEPVASTRKHS